MYNIVVLPTLYPKSERGKGFLGKWSAALPECMYEKWCYFHFPVCTGVEEWDWSGVPAFANGCQEGITHDYGI